MPATCAGPMCTSLPTLGTTSNTTHVEPVPDVWACHARHRSISMTILSSLSSPSSCFHRFYICIGLCLSISWNRTISWFAIKRRWDRKNDDRIGDDLKVSSKHEEVSWEDKHERKWIPKINQIVTYIEHPWRKIINDYFIGNFCLLHVK